MLEINSSGEPSDDHLQLAQDTYERVKAISAGKISDRDGIMPPLRFVGDNLARARQAGNDVTLASLEAAGSEKTSEDVFRTIVEMVHKELGGTKRALESDLARHPEPKMPADAQELPPATRRFAHDRWRGEFDVRDGLAESIHQTESELSPSRIVEGLEHRLGKEFLPPNALKIAERMVEKAGTVIAH